MARAVSTLGVRRGITEFARYGYQQRNNLATHFAVPLGRFRVSDRIEPQLLCLDDLDAWLTRLRREARGPAAPARLRQAERRLLDALFAVSQHPKEADRWQRVLLALAGVESVMVSGPGFRAGPIPPLRPEWVRAAHDGADPASARELRLALSLALQHWRDGHSESDPILPDTVRRHWIPLDETGRSFATFGTAAQRRLAVRPDVVMTGRRGTDDATALLARRLVEASQKGERRLPLVAVWGAAAAPSDLAAVLAGHVSIDRTMALARVLTAVDRRRWREVAQPLPSPRTTDWPDDAWLAIRLAMLPWPLESMPPIGVDPAIVRRLAAGDTASALGVALRRLRSAGLTPTVRLTNRAAGGLWATALAFPVSRSTGQRFVERLDRSSLSSSKELYA